MNVVCNDGNKRCGNRCIPVTQRCIAGAKIREATKKQSLSTRAPKNPPNVPAVESQINLA